MNEPLPFAVELQVLQNETIRTYLSKVVFRLLGPTYSTSNTTSITKTVEAILVRACDYIRLSIPEIPAKKDWQKEFGDQVFQTMRGFGLDSFILEEANNLFRRSEVKRQSADEAQLTTNCLFQLSLLVGCAFAALSRRQDPSTLLKIFVPNSLYTHAS